MNVHLLEPLAGGTVGACGEGPEEARDKTKGS